MAQPISTRPLEKTVPFGVVAGRLVGAGMILAGVLSLAGVIHIA